MLNDSFFCHAFTASIRFIHNICGSHWYWMVFLSFLTSFSFAWCMHLTTAVHLIWIMSSERLMLLSVVAEYRLVSKKGEGTFSEVLKAQNVVTGQVRIQLFNITIVTTIWRNVRVRITYCIINILFLFFFFSLSFCLSVCLLSVCLSVCLMLLQFFAVKCMKNHFKSIEQVNSLREIQALRRLNPHENIIDLEEVL